MYNNYDYPAGSDNERAPWNEVEVPEKDFEVTCSQSLSRTVTVTTNNYIPGASGVDYEDDGEGGVSACGWQDPDDTSNTDWGKEYDEGGHYTPLQLIQMYKETLEEQLKSWEGIEDTRIGRAQIEKIEHLIEECESWTEDETEYIL